MWSEEKEKNKNKRWVYICANKTLFGKNNFNHTLHSYYTYEQRECYKMILFTSESFKCHYLLSNLAEKLEPQNLHRRVETDLSYMNSTIKWEHERGHFCEIFAGPTNYPSVISTIHPSVINYLGGLWEITNYLRTT